jgi:protein-S-isoprenylcysteine O-methyltransferase Ste14
MNQLNRKAIAGLLQLLIVLAVLIFVPSWTIHYWQGWLFLALFAACVIAISFYLMKNDPHLLEGRVKAGPGAEQSPFQKIIQSLAAIAFIAMFIVASLDHRFGWSIVPTSVVVLGDVLVVFGLYFVFLVFKENTFAAGTIGVGAEQKVISTGPYAMVRHPMYIGALVMLVGVPLALGSWWALLGVVLMTLVIVFRLLDEEKFLAINLAGYSEYQRKVRYHLVPMIW